MFSARVAHEDAATVIELAGDLGYETREAINAAVMDALTVAAPKLIVDLQAVNFIDSIGVEAAIASPARAASALSMAFCVEPSATVRLILVEMGLDDLLERAHGPQVAQHSASAEHPPPSREGARLASEIHEHCAAPGCPGTVVFIPLRTSVGAAGECDVCGATFRLVGGEVTMTQPPKRDGD